MVPIRLGSGATTVTTPILPDRLVLTVPEAARALRIGRNQAYLAVRRGEIPSIKIGRRVLVPRIGVQRLLDNSDDGLHRRGHDDV